MTFYHGTVESSVSGILANGLQPEYLKKFQALIPNGVNKTTAEIEASEPWVYVGSRDVAEDFANLRTGYLRAPRNADVALGTGMFIYKTNDAPVEPKAMPALIRVDLPDGWYLEPDPRKRGGYRSMAIPAQYMRQVPMSEFKPTTVTPMPREEWLNVTNPYAGIFEQLFGLSQVESY